MFRVRILVRPFLHLLFDWAVIIEMTGAKTVLAYREQCAFRQMTVLDVLRYDGPVYCAVLRRNCAFSSEAKTEVAIILVACFKLMARRKFTHVFLVSEELKVHILCVN